MQRIFRTFVLILFTMLIVNGLGTECLASCGDWLADSDSEMNSHVPQSSEREPRSLLTESMAPLDDESQKNCHGPQCRQTPPSPLQPIPVKVRISRNEGLVFDSVLKIANSDTEFSCWQLLNETAVAGHPTALERPPQFEV